LEVHSTSSSGIPPFSSTTDGFVITNANRIAGMRIGWDDTHSGFYQQAFRTTNTPVLPISIKPLDGNVRIGTTAPGAKLDVAGDINTSTQYIIGGNRVLSIQGSDNLFAGVDAGKNNTFGIFNSFFGPRAGNRNVTGSENSFFGTSAGFNTTTGGGNSFFGIIAGSQNVDGQFNTAIGDGANVGSSNLHNATAIGWTNQVD